MNINKAKEEVKNTCIAYLSKNEFGEYNIPIERQRPICLIGPPGIGKTAIMEQVAQELDVGIISYSMTHHTRQSALGLPFISKKNYGGTEYSVSEYTMSEVIASVYDMMEETGKNKVILFLDEINCVSDTLKPSMLQFLQYKIFGTHKVPDGCIVVTAGNPPEYNKSVSEFDAVTWDRLKRIDVEADYETWKCYAIKSNVHTSILSYLDLRKDNFYKITTTVEGKNIVTARGWVDLSTIMLIYEDKKIPVTKDLIRQYIQNDDIARDFASYYDLFVKYKSNYQIDKILAGSYDEEIVIAAQNARHDERLAVTAILRDGVLTEMKDVIINAARNKNTRKALDTVRARRGADPVTEINKQCTSLLDGMKKDQNAGCLTADKKRVIRLTVAELEKLAKKLTENHGADANSVFAEYCKDEAEKLCNQYNAAVKKLTNVFRFIETAFADGPEMVIFMTELTITDASLSFIGNSYCGERIGTEPCNEYLKHTKLLKVTNRYGSITERIINLGLDT